MEEPTERQNDVLDYIRSRVQEGSHPPSIREIASRFKVNIRAIQDHLEALERKGFLKRKAGLARGLQLADKLFQIPILGRVTAGAPALAVEDVQGYLPINFRLGPGHYFALKVKGDSMIGAGILEGDFVIVRRQPTAELGDVIVALVEGEESTVKRFQYRQGEPCLEAANPAYAPIRRRPFEVMGKVIEVRRKYERA
jgi:repressor LexA